MPSDIPPYGYKITEPTEREDFVEVTGFDARVSVDTDGQLHIVAQEALGDDGVQLLNRVAEMLSHGAFVRDSMGSAPS